MPFVARCPFCRKEFRAAETMEGRSVTCKHCGDAFTLARAESLPAAAPRSIPARRTSTPVERGEQSTSPKPVGPSDATPLPTIRQISAASVPAEPALHRDSTPMFSSEPPKPSSGKIPVLGVASLCLAGVALLAASFPSLRFGTLAVAGLGFVLGVLGWLIADTVTKRRRWMPVTGAVVSLAALVIASFFPRLFSITLRDDAVTTQDDPAKILAVPIGGSAIEPPSEWLDASRFSVQQGDLRVRVLSASIGPVELSSKSVSRSQSPYLRVRLEISNARVRKQLAYQGWARAQGVVLLDSSGKSYQLHSFGPGVDITGQQKDAVALGPFNRTTDVLIFEAPSDSALKAMEWLRLELPASTASGVGSLKFQIPRAMIQRQ
jgi:hypothetical protein